MLGLYDIELLYNLNYLSQKSKNRTTMHPEIVENTSCHYLKLLYLTLATLMQSPPIWIYNHPINTTPEKDRWKPVGMMTDNNRRLLCV